MAKAKAEEERTALAEIAKTIVKDEVVKAVIKRINRLEDTEFKTLFNFDKSVITTIFDELISLSIRKLEMFKGGKKTRKKTKKRKNKKSKRCKTKRRKSKKH